MKKDNRSHILLRYGLVVILILLLSAFIVKQLCETTIINVDNWNEAARKQLSVAKPIIPERGKILASDGSVLATNLNFYTARIDYRAEKFVDSTFEDSVPLISVKMAEYFPVRTSEEWKEHLLKPLKIEKDKRPRGYKLLSGLSYEDMMTIKSFPYFKHPNSNKTGLTFEKYMRRFNPYGEMARRSIGGVGETGTDLKVKEIHGISGLEKALDSLLYGQVGYYKLVNLTKNMYNLPDIPAVPGCDIVTTIDINMQDIVESELNNVLDTCGADWGVAVLMDVKTGDIKAISNLELNPDGKGYIEARNRAVSRFEPGSVVKTLSMMIALEDNIVTNLDEELPTGSGWAYANGRPITDAHRSTSIRVGEVLEQSSNIGMARIITRKYDENPGGFYSRIKSLGFLEPMKTGIAGEFTPRFDSIPDNRGGRIALSRMSYGYATEIPPLYTLALYNAIANDGVFVRPRLVKEIRGAVDSVLPVSYMGNGRACSPATAATLRQMLTNVVWGDHGTGKYLRNKTVKIAGKTGTCYTIERDTTISPKPFYNTKKKRLAFCGFFPADNPMYSCVVLVCYPKKNFFGAATTSGQVLRNIALKLYSRGMLDNSSDYHTISPSLQSPTFYASASGRKAYEKVKNDFSIQSHRAIRKPTEHSPGTIPDVKGYGLREAIVTLETAGYNVDYSGSGHVHSMSPSPGEKAPKGTHVKLILGN